MKVPHIPLAKASACGLIFVACSADTLSPGGGGNGGASGTGTGTVAGSTGAPGGTGGSGSSPDTCGNVTACGGDVVGTWTATAACLKLSGGLDVGSLGAGCPTAPVTGTLKVSGSFSANSDGTYSDHTTTTGTAQFKLAPACLTISSTPVMCEKAGSLLGPGLGYSAVACTPSAGGDCACEATINQQGGLGLPAAAPTTSGNHTSAGNQLTLTLDSGDPAKYPYCVAGGTLTLSPQSVHP